MSANSEEFESVTVCCDSAEQFIHELDETHERWGDHSWIYRGQNDESWELMPSLFRDTTKGRIAFYEIGLILDFVKNANSVNLPLPSNNPDHYFYYKEPKIISQSGVDDAYGDRLQYDFTHAVFAIAQHSGVPTRFLDFSYDPNVAAYFAAETSGLSQKLGYSDEWKGKYFDDILDSFAKGFDAHNVLIEYQKKWNEIIALLPQEIAVWAVQIDGMQVHTSLRLLDHSYTEILNLQAQKGAFVWDKNRYELKGEPLRPFDDEMAKLIEPNGIYKVTLPLTEVEDLRALLTKKGYFPAQMTPSYVLTGRLVVELTKQRLSDIQAESPHNA